MAVNISSVLNSPRPTNYLVMMDSYGTINPKSINAAILNPQEREQLNRDFVEIQKEVKSALDETEAEIDKAKKLQKTTKKANQGPIRSTKDFIRAVKKIGIDVQEYSKGALGGLAYGSLGGLAVFSATKIGKGISQYIKEKDFDKALKSGNKLAITLGAITGVVILFANMWEASLNADEKKADVDHRYTPTPAVDNK